MKIVRLRQDNESVYAQEDYYNSLSMWGKFKLLFVVATMGKLLVKERSK